MTRRKIPATKFDRMQHQNFIRKCIFTAILFLGIQLNSGMTFKFNSSLLVMSFIGYKNCGIYNAFELYAKILYICKRVPGKKEM
jgi:hypothetical protein